MKKKITFLTVLMLGCFSVGVFLASLYIKNTTAEFSRLIELGKIEDLRKTLVIRTQTAQSDLYTVRTPLSKTLDSIENHVSKLDDAAKNCLGCHHQEGIAKRLEEIQTLIADYQNALSYYITAAADADRMGRLKFEAAAIGDKLLLAAEDMSAEANRRLGVLTQSGLEKVRAAQNILLGTTIITLLAGVIVGMRIVSSITRPAEELVKATRSIASGDLGYHITYRDNTEFGEIARNFNAMSAALKNSYEKLQDEIAERRKIEEELIKAQRLESLGMLAGGIAHDFNNLLTVILGNIDLARMSVSGNHEAAELLTYATRASVRARDLTRQLLTFSRGGDPLMAPISIEEIIMEAVSFALRGSVVTCQYDFQPDLWPLVGDRGQISQVIHNLVLNAREAMPAGGAVVLGVRNRTIDAADGLQLTAGRYIEISVKDSGLGISDENLKKIFDPYFTTKNFGPKRGTGLGLAICYSIIKRHQGLITVNSGEGKGSEFLVYLNASSGAACVPAAVEATPGRGSGRILFMDDEEAVRNIAGKMLGRLGYEVTFASHGMEAIELYSGAYGSSEPFAAVIMDLIVPGGMGGAEALERLVRIDPKIKAIVSSGYASSMDMSEYRKYGIRAFISKPYKISELGRILESVLSQTEYTFRNGEARANSRDA